MKGICILSGGGTDLEDLGFLNVPDGDWIFKTGTKQLTSKDENIIPICQKASWSNSGKRGNQSDGTSISTSSSFVGGSASGSASVGKALMGASLSVSISGSANNLFLPLSKNMDLTQVQNSFTSGTFTVWLEKQ